MFEAFSDGTAAITSRVLHSLEEAEAWLARSGDEKRDDAP
jgi:hypothetical protein